MQLASQLGFGLGALVLGFALIWLGMPNKIGENPPFLRNGLMEMVYPATALACNEARICPCGDC
jgi:hypothetical protein